MLSMTSPVWSVEALLVETNVDKFEINFLELFKLTSMYSILRKSWVVGSEGSALTCLSHLVMVTGWYVYSAGRDQGEVMGTNKNKIEKKKEKKKKKKKKKKIGCGKLMDLFSLTPRFSVITRSL